MVKRSKIFFIVDNMRVFLESFRELTINDLDNKSFIKVVKYNINIWKLKIFRYIRIIIWII